MKSFAIAMSAYNPAILRNMGIPLFRMLPTRNKRPLECKVSIYMASSIKEAKDAALSHCKIFFPEQNGWEQHVVEACDIEKTLLQTPD